MSIRTTDGTCLDQSCLLQCLDETDKENIGNHCKSVVSGLLRECEELHRRYLVEGSVKCRGIPQECIDHQMHNLVRGVKSYVGQGANHRDLMDFIDVASFIGLLPFEAVTCWASVEEEETSDAYKAIQEIYNKWSQESQSNSKNYKELTVSVASQSFSAFVKWIASNVNWNFTHSLASNILNELFSERRNGNPSEAWSPSKHHDVLYLYKHRKGKPHPLYPRRPIFQSSQRNVFLLFNVLSTLAILPLLLKVLSHNLRRPLLF
jgi:hypothetical protein